MLWPGALASCPLVLHIFSLGGYTFAQMLLLMSQNPGRQSSVAQCLRGSLDHMALGECARVRMRGLLVTLRGLQSRWTHSADHGV